MARLVLPQRFYGDDNRGRPRRFYGSPNDKPRSSSPWLPEDYYRRSSSPWLPDIDRCRYESQNDLRRGSAASATYTSSDLTQSSGIRHWQSLPSLADSNLALAKKNLSAPVKITLSVKKIEKQITEPVTIPRTIFTPQYNCVDIVSVYENKILVGSTSSQDLSVYIGGHHTTTMTLSCGIKDAAWTSKGDVIVSTTTGQLLIVTGNKIKKRLPMANPQRFAMSLDKSMCLADGEDGVFCSKENDTLFKFIFRTKTDFKCTETMKVSPGEYWTIEEFDEDQQRICRYVTSRSGRIVGRYDVFLPTRRQVNRDDMIPELEISRSPSMAVDKNFVYICETRTNCIYAFTHSGNFSHRPFSDKDKLDVPCRLAVDRKRRLLFVGQRNSVKSFNLDYKDDCTIS